MSELEAFKEEMKEALLEVSEKVRMQSKLNSRPVAQARCNAQWAILDLMLLFLNKRESDMQKLKSDLVRQVVSLDDLEPIKKRSELEEKIQEAVAVLEQLTDENRELQRTGASLPAKAIKEDIEWGHFSAKISQMRIDNKIPQDITSAKRGEKFYLVKLPKGQTVQPRRRKETVR
jgi:hypothetical protein